MQFFIFLIAIGSGALNPFQAVNAELFKYWKQPVWTAAWVYLSGLLAVLFLQAILRQAPPSHEAVTAAPWWAWVGGAISVVTTVGGLMYAQKLGSGTFTGLSLTASVIVSILLDQFGWIGFRQHTASPLRIAGGVLMIVGVWLVSRF